MKMYSQLFLLVLFVTCQASLLPLNRQLVSRQGLAIRDNPLFKQELLQPYQKHAAKKTTEPVEPKAVFEPNNPHAYLRSYLDPVDSHYALYNSKKLNREDNNRENVLRQSDQMRQVQAQQVAQQYAQLDQIDREALSKVSESDRQLLLSQLSQADREALLIQFDKGQLGEVLPVDETRFGVQSGGFAGAASQIGAGAGGYIGRKLAGALGAKLGAAVGSYLGAAVANRLIPSSNNNTSLNSNVNQNGAKPGFQYGGSYGGSYGAVLVSK